MSSSSLPEGWIPHLHAELEPLKEIPLWGNTPAFPWETLSKQLQEVFRLPDLKLNAKEWKSKTEEDIHKSLPNPYCLKAQLAPLEGELSWIMPENDFHLFFSWVMQGATLTYAALSEELRSAFTQFLTLEMTHQIQKLEVCKGLTLRPTEDNALPKGPQICLDISVTKGQETLWGCLTLSPSFRKSWKSYQDSLKRPPLPIAARLKVSLPVALQVGKLHTTLAEWKGLHPGDCILMPDNTYDPVEKKGPILLTFKQHPIFRGRLKASGVKLIDYPLHIEESSPMAQPPPTDPKAAPAKAADSPPAPPPTKASTPPTPTPPPASAAPPAAPAPSPAKSPPPPAAAAPTPAPAKAPTPPETEATPSPKEFLGEDEDFFVEDEELSKALAKELSAGADKAEEKPKEDPNAPITPEEIPVDISVEIAHLTITAGKLLELRPGNELSLDKEVDNHVDLVVHGKRIGTGELIRIGEVLGIRILSL